MSSDDGKRIIISLLIYR